MKKYICLYLYIYIHIRKKQSLLLNTRWTSLSFRCPAGTFSSPCQRWMSSPISAMAFPAGKGNPTCRFFSIQLHGQLGSLTRVKLPLELARSCFNPYSWAPSFDQSTRREPKVFALIYARCHLKCLPFGAAVQLGTQEHHCLRVALAIFCGELRGRWCFVVVSKEGSDIYIYILYIHMYTYLRIISQYLLSVVVDVESVWS